MIGIIKTYGLLALKGAAIGLVVTGVNRKFRLVGPAMIKHTY